MTTLVDCQGLVHINLFSDCGSLEVNDFSV